MYKCISTSIYSCNSSSLFLSRWYGNNSRGTIILNCFPPCMYAAASVFSMYNYNRYDFDLLMICSGDGGNGGGGGSNGGSSLVFSRYLCQDLSKLPCPAGEPFHSLSISFSHLSLKDEQSRRWDKHTHTHTNERCYICTKADENRTWKSVRISLQQQQFVFFFSPFSFKKINNKINNPAGNWIADHPCVCVSTADLFPFCCLRIKILSSLWINKKEQEDHRAGVLNIFILLLLFFFFISNKTQKVEHFSLSTLCNGLSKFISPVNRTPLGSFIVFPLFPFFLVLV